MYMEIRKAQTTDIERLVTFQLGLAGETEDFELDAAVVRRGITAMFDDPAKGIYYVAEIDGAVAGCLINTFEWSDWRNGTTLWIQSVYVDKAYRGRGVYEALYAHLQQMVNDSEEYTGIRLYVDKRNVRAQKVYQRNGMDGEHYQLYEWMKGF